MTLAGPAQFQETGVTLAIFFGEIEVVVCGSGCAVEFMIPAQAYVVGLVFLVMLRPAEADTRANGVGAVELVLGFAQVAVDIYVVTKDMGPEEFRVDVVVVVFVGIELAQAQLCCDVVRVRVVADVVAGDIGVVVRIELARAENGFVVQAVCAVSANENTGANVLLVAVTAGSLVAFGVVAVAVF